MMDLLRKKMQLFAHANVPFEAIRYFKANLHTVMDDAFPEAAQELRDHLSERNTGSFWKQWSQVVHDAFIDMRLIPQESWNDFRGAGYCPSRRTYAMQIEIMQINQYIHGKCNNSYNK